MTGPSDEKEEHLKSNQKISKVKSKKLPKGATRLRVQFDITYQGHPGKEPEGKSMTQPDMSLTIGQLLEHHTQGKPVTQKEPVYFEMEVPTFSDLTDVEEYNEQLKNRLEQTTAFIKQEQEKAKADAKAAAEAKAKSVDTKPAENKEAEQATETEQTTND